MPTKEESILLQELSQKAFKRRYAYKKLLNQGIIHRVDIKGPIPYRKKLSVDECVRYLKETIRMQEQLTSEVKNEHRR